jgi:hypothetical protein
VLRPITDPARKTMIKTAMMMVDFLIFIAVLLPSPARTIFPMMMIQGVDIVKRRDRP